MIILYYDNNSKKRYPGLFALINNKFENGYKELFKSILNILTIENSQRINTKGDSWRYVEMCGDMKK